MSIQLEIHRHNLQRVNNIFNGFEGQDMSKDISKAITEEEFHERFSAGYQVFTKGNIQDFVKAVETDLIEKGFDSNAISTALDNEGKTLESVLIKKDGKVFEVFVKAVETDIEKGGEGSKGGKIIGHTKSGKPVYASKNAKHISTFNSKDHSDAAYHHLDHAMKLKKEGKDGEAQRHSDMYDEHIKSSQHKAKQEEIEKESEKTKKD